MIGYPPRGETFTEPLQALRRIQEEINRSFGNRRVFEETAEYPPINIWRSDDGIVVTAEMPGVAIEDIELSVHQSTLSIKGTRAAEADIPGASYHRRERVLGPFARSVQLPFPVDAERVRARVDAGILTVVLPRPETDKPRKIHINQV